MIISNRNTKKRFYTVLFTLMAISVLDLILANLAAGEQFFWGYLFIVNIALVILVYFVLGKPIFEFYVEDDVIEFDSEILTGLFKERLFIVKDNLMDYSIRKRLFWKKLTIEFYNDGRLVKRNFSLSYLSKAKVRRLTKNLSKLVQVNQEADERQLFI